METLTGIENLISDPYFLGAGLHQIPRGGKLAVHADFNRHNKFPLDRRLNILVYLNKDWKEEYGGHLELWDRDMSKCKKIAPLFNRMVVFPVTDWAYHGHPEPLTCPEGRTRKSIALYYYTNGRPENEVKKGKKSTQFVPRPGENFPELNRLEPNHPESNHTGWRFWLTRLTPPILLDGVKRVVRGRSHVATGENGDLLYPSGTASEKEK